MKKIRNKRQLQMLKHKLKYKEKMLQRDFADASATVLSDLNWKVRDFTFDLGLRVFMELFQLLKKRKKSKAAENKD